MTDRIGNRPQFIPKPVTDKPRPSPGDVVGLSFEREEAIADAKLKKAARPDGPGDVVGSRFEKAEAVADAKLLSPSAPGGDSQATRLQGLKFGDTTANDGGRIKQLHDDLMRLGYLPQDFTTDVGYGKRFGSRTLAALQQFEADNGLPATSSVNDAVVSALANPKPQPEGLDKLVGLKPGAAAPADKGTIKTLQDEMVKLGYLPADITKDVGYGKNFGPKTLAAVRQFQEENGLPPTGAIDQATADAMKNPRPRPEGVARGLNEVYRNDLGLVKGPMAKLPDGSMRQDFDNGYIQLDPNRVVHICRTDGSDIVPPRKLGTVATTEEGNAYFVTQWGGTAFNSAQGAPYGYNDCGPTSGLVALSALGLLPHPSADGAETAIDSVRDACLGYDSTYSTEMGFGSLQHGLEKLGAKCTQLSPPSLDNIDKSLAEGNPVIIGGDPWNAWGAAECAKGNYLNGQDPGGHFVTLLGKTADGKYIVADPLVKGGTLEVTADQLKIFAQKGFGAMEVARP